MERPLAKNLDSLLSKVKDNENHISQLENKKQELEIDLLNQVTSGNIDSNFILSGIKKLRQDSFRKAKVSKKRSIIQEVIKAIHVHPENVIQIEFWTNAHHSKLSRETSYQPGVVLPFRKLTKPLEASFHQNNYKKDRFFKCEKSCWTWNLCFVP